jgi:peptidoglycan/LPS O-acetylase OafA/YrhL
MKRNLHLDILRGIAILLVIGAHQHINNYTGVSGWLARAWHDHGVVGVPLFFALSGYLIGGLILDEIRNYGSFDVMRFLVRRGFKLYPAYFVFIIYLVMMPTVKALLSGGDFFTTAETKLQEFTPNLMFLQNYVGSNPAAHTWSLAVEEHFYLMLPFLVLWLHRNGSIRWLTIIGLLSPVIFTLIRGLCWEFGDPYMQKMFATHLELDGLLLGVGLRSLKEYSPMMFVRLSLGRWVWLLLGVVLVLQKSLILPSSACGSALILLGVLHMSAQDFGLFARWGYPLIQSLSWVGRHSYSIYLWHVTAMGIISGKLLSHLQLDTSQTVPWFLHRTLLCVSIVLVGWVLARLVEWPALRMRDHLFPSPSLLTPITEKSLTSNTVS